MRIQNCIRKALIFAMYWCFLLFLFFFFLRVVVHLYDLPYPRIFYQERLSMTMFFASIGCYLVLILWSLIDIKHQNNMSDLRRDILKKVLIVKPINGVTLYSFCTQDNAIAELLSKNPVISFFFFVRRLSFYSVFFAILMLFLINNQILLALIAGLVVLTIFTHLFYELLILTRIMQKSDDELVEYLDYFRAIQPPLAYSAFYYKEIRRRKS